MRHVALSRWPATVIAAAILACANDDDATTVVVSVDSDLNAPVEIDAVDIVVAGGELRFPFLLGEGQGRHRLPVRAAITSGGRPDRQFDIEAVALKSDTPVLSQVAAISFVQGAGLQVELFLSRCCLSRPACSPDGSCQQGACVPHGQIGKRRTLARGERPAVIQPADGVVIDAGPSELGSGDASAVDGGVDALAEALGQVEAGMNRAPPGTTDARPDASDADTGSAPTGKPALLVVGDPGAPTAGDVRLRAVLQSRGFEVRLGDDGGAVSEAAGFQLVVLASSCGASSLGSKFRDLATPVITMESGVFGEMQLTGAIAGTDYGEEAGTSVTIIRSAHPLAAILGDAVSVVSRTAAMTWGRPGMGAVQVATFQGIPGKVAIFGYEPGAQMVGMMAPARRAGLFAADAAAEWLSPEGIQLVAAAIDWSSR